MSTENAPKRLVELAALEIPSLDLLADGSASSEGQSAPPSLADLDALIDKIVDPQDVYIVIDTDANPPRLFQARRPD